MAFRFSSALRNQLGLSIVEGLVASAIVATTAAGTAGLVTYIGKQSRRAQLLNRAVTVQSTLVNAILNKSQYSTSTTNAAHNAAVAQLINGGSAAGMPILAYPEDPKKPEVLAIVGQRVGYTLDDTSMNTCADPSACPIWIDVDISCDGLTTQGCRAAYRVTVAALAKDDVVPAPLGAPGKLNAQNPRAFVPFAADFSDHTLPISYDFFQQKPQSDCSADGDRIFITGMDRLTGQVSCIARDDRTCPAPMIADGVTTDIIDGKRRLMLSCHPLASVQCPKDYVLEAMDFGQTDPGKTGTLTGTGSMNGLPGTCVYRWKDDVPWQGPAFQTAPTATTATYQAKVCNTGVYEAKTTSACDVVWDSNPEIPCPATCPDFDGTGKQIGSHDCSTPPIQATVTKSWQEPTALNGNVGRCTITVNQSSCSGGPTQGVAHGVSAGSCQVLEKKPGRNPSLKKAPVGGVLSP